MGISNNADNLFVIDKSELFEFENRYCPICGDEVKAGSPFHRCEKKKLKALEKERKKQEKLQEEGILDEIKAFDDMLEEYERYTNPEEYHKEEDEPNYV